MQIAPCISSSCHDWDFEDASIVFGFYPGREFGMREICLRGSYPCKISMLFLHNDLVGLVSNPAHTSSDAVLNRFLPVASAVVARFAS